MSYYSAETVNPSKWLTPSEVQAVIERNKINVRSNRMKGRKQFPDRAQNFVIFRLACMGLRVSELTGLNCGDLIVTGERPVIIIRKETTKGVRGRHKGKEITIRRARKVPLYWDKGTLDDLKAWLEFRKAQIARQLAAGGKQIQDQLSRKPWPRWWRPLGDWRSEPFVCHQSGPEREGSRHGNRMSRLNISRKWTTVMRQALGYERSRQLSVHCGRHTFITHCMASERNVAEIRDAVGHRSLDILNRYTGALESNCDDLYLANAPVYTVRERGTARVDSIEIPEGLWGRLDAYALREGVSVAQAIEIALRLMLDRNPGSTIQRDVVDQPLRGNQYKRVTQPTRLPESDPTAPAS